MKKFLLIFILILSLLGAIDAGYLLIQSVGGGRVICPNIPIGRFNLDQCNIVLSTPYSKFWGFPMALYGLAAYLMFAILALYILTNKRPGAQKFILFLSGLGFLISIYLIYVQFFVIEAICFYCLISAALMTLIFIASIIYNMKYSDKGV